jgi:hypothetical protein
VIVYRGDLLEEMDVDAVLRELALLWMADQVEENLADYRARHGIKQPGRGR